MKTELKPIFDTRKSFYGKALCKTEKLDDGYQLVLYSYDTRVAYIIFKDDYIKYVYCGHYSNTTTRHQKEFFKQNGLTDNEIKNLFKDMTLVKYR